jgi:hypothetical protein
MLTATSGIPESDAEREDSTLRSAVEHFLGLTPDSAVIRDVLTHFDEYEAGRGRLQREGRLDKTLNMYSEWNKDEYWLRVGSLRIRRRTRCGCEPWGDCPSGM